MPTLNIEGRKVKVDDAFMQMSPEQQNKTVEEIASQLGPAQVEESGAESTPKPEGKTPSGRHLTFEEGQMLMAADTPLGKAASGLSGFLDLPVVGPYIVGGTQKLAAGVSSLLNGESYSDNLETAKGLTEASKQVNPGTNLTGQIAGNLAAFGGIGSTARGARLLGITGRNLGTRAATSAASSAAISAGDTAVRGGDAADVGASGIIGLGIGGAIPIVGAGVSAATRAIGSRVAPTINAIRNPDAEAARRVGMAVTRDIRANPQNVMANVDEVVARQNNIPIINADRGGETTRALARSVANQSPEARSIIENTASDRFGGQSQRAMGFINRIMGGQVDDLGYQEAIRAAARRANAPAYNAAYRSPQAQQLFTPRMQQLMQSPTFRRAVERVPAKSADRGAVRGEMALQNPFTQNSRGQYVLRQREDGTLIAPTLEFWDHVQRNLRPLADRAARAGDNTTASEVSTLRNALNAELDTAVPAFQQARRGAAAFFGADDAVDAGRNFANSPKAIPEAQRAIQQFTAPEREAFATGYASELIDKIRASGDRTNVINSVFGNQAARESIEMVLGPQRAREVEAYVRVEGLVDRLRGAMGNSTTARQLMELGIGAGGGAYLTGDWSGALTGAAAARGARYLGQRVDNRVMTRIAHLLTSDNRGNIALAVRQAAAQPQYMRALEQMSRMLAAPARAGASMAAQ